MKPTNTLLQILFVGLALFFATFLGGILMSFVIDAPPFSKIWLIELLKGFFWGFFWGLLTAPLAVFKIKRQRIIGWIMFFILGITGEIIISLILLI